MRMILAGVVGVALAAGLEVTPGQPPPPSTLEGPLTVNGSVEMTTGPMAVDGGVSAQSYQGGTATLSGLTVSGPATLGPNVTLLGTITTSAPLSSPTVAADAGTFGTLTAGPSNLGPPVNLAGPVTVTGSTTFSEPPAGVVRKGTLTRATSLSLAVGCSTLGTVSVAGVTTDAACNVTRRPAPILNLGITLDCYAATPGVVTVRACALVSLLSAPAGDYGVTLVGE